MGSRPVLIALVAPWLLVASAAPASEGAGDRESTRAPPSCPAVSPNLLDGTFEAGPPWPSWPVQSSSYFGTPLCTVPLCGTGGGTALPYSGGSWAWFGGGAIGERAELAQTVLLPRVPDLRLRFQRWVGFTLPTDLANKDLLYYTVDRTQAVSYSPPDYPEPAYSTQDVDLTPYADGRLHQVGFEFYQRASRSNISIDDVQLVSCPVPDVSIADVSVAQGATSPSSAIFDVTLSFASDRIVTVDYMVIPGTAQAMVDFDFSNVGPGYLHFYPGTTTLPIVVPILPNPATTGPKTFFVDLYAAYFGSIVRSRATGTIWPGVDLRVKKTDGRISAAPGDTVTYTIVAANASGDSHAVTGARLVDVPPVALSSVAWTCTADGGATCTPSGTAVIDDAVDLPVGGTATYSLAGTVVAQPARLVNTASISAPGGYVETTPSDNVSTDEDVLACGSQPTLVGDGRPASVTVAPASTQWLLLPTIAGHSYSVELEDTQGSAAPSAVTLFRGDDACTGASTAVYRDTSSSDPRTLLRLAFTSSGSDGNYRLRFANASGAPVAYRVAFAETTLFSASWTTNGAYETYCSFQNTTDATLSVTLALTRADGTSAGTTTLSVPSGATVATNTASLGVVRGAAGTARLTHDGPPGALVAEAAIANFGFTPAYVQPVRFRSVRAKR